jgi:serine/threonine-protein kinase
MKTRLGHYDIVAELGRGGMGVVYKGHESSLNRYVAIKVLADSLAHDEGVKERFLREARSMAALNDPHIIQIYFIGDDGGQTYFVMEFVDGESLGSMLQRETRLPVEAAARVVHQTALGLASAHDRGVIHRDIKPGNLMIGSRGVVKIADFGIALSNQDLSKKLTSTGEFVGTPGYLSPEVCLGKPVDQRSDIFSLGVVLFEMLAGRMPFTDVSPLGLMLEVVKADIPDVRELNAQVDPEIATILTRMIAKDPADRYQDCHQLAADLARHPLVAGGGPISVKPKLSPAAATLVGQRTPAPVSASQPITAPTPAGARVPPSEPTSWIKSDAATAKATRERATAVEARRSASVVPWAIAALLLVGVASAAYTWRAQIPAFGSLFGGSAQLSVSNAANSNPLPMQPAGADTPARNPAAPAGDEAAANPATTTPVSTATDAASVPEATLASASTVAATPATNDTSPASATAPSVAVPTAVPTDSAAVTPAPPQQIAKATPPRPPVAPRPQVPTIALLTGGDDTITGPAEEAVGEMLRRRGFRVIEGGHVDGDRPEVRRFAGRADAVVFVHARPVGSQELTYYGQSSTLYTVQLGIRTYAVADAALLGSAPAEQVNFTTLNAADKARETVAPMLDRVARDLAPYDRKHARG